MSGVEQELLKACIELLRARGCYCQRINSGKIIADYGGKKRMIHLADKGTPDIFACVPDRNGQGYFLAIELKKDAAEIKGWSRQWDNFCKERKITASNERSVRQHEEQQKITDAGGEVLVCSSLDDLNDFITELQK